MFLFVAFSVIVCYSVLERREMVMCAAVYI